MGIKSKLTTTEGKVNDLEKGFNKLEKTVSEIQENTVERKSVEKLGNILVGVQGDVKRFVSQVNELLAKYDEKIKALENNLSSIFEQMDKYENIVSGQEKKIKGLEKKAHAHSAAKK